MSTSKRMHRQEKLARIYDSEIMPIWSQRFGRMLLRGLEVPPRANVLDVACGTGYPSLELLRRMDDNGRVIAIDSSSAMLDVARKKAGELAGKRIFFRTESASPRLSFADEVYDVVVCNLGIQEMPNPRQALNEFARVAKMGGRVICTLPLAGTWGEFYDIFREVLVKQDRDEQIERLRRHIMSYPQPEDLERWMNIAGLTDTQVDVEEFSLLFRSSREFFFAPVVEYGPLSQWKEVAGKGQDLQDVFWSIKEAIDAYFGSRAFQVTVKAGCIQGVRTSVPFDDELSAASRAIADEDAIQLEANEVEMLEEEEDREESWAEELKSLGDPDEPGDPGDGNDAEK
ncbi:MAG: methyltransferase domain-containing protein [Pseudomonadota bacterium]